MLLDLQGVPPAPAGFGACDGCAYRYSGTPATCYSCAIATTEEVVGARCESCGQPIGKMRLMAFPRATLCLTCKQREERR